ncbi:cytochrome P450 [Epithele typhae]|uniref:cytochrome P450 n=1 Tax=Epithele typhae TaxID=378194 RepID=UPI00200843EC|nr:cytochrome P450 [Epithele typhae]KAH9941249.1 cytochrome P450 [Epithele typhae]
MNTLCSIIVSGLLFYVPLFIAKKLKLFSKSPLDVIPGPPAKSWLKGHLGLMYRRDAEPWRESLYERYGSVVRFLGLFGEPRLFIFDPVALHTVLIKEHHIFEEPDTHLLSNDLMFGPGLVSVAGDQHKRQRKILNPAFSPAHLRSTLPIMYSVTYRFRDAMLARIKGDHWTEIDMLGWLGRTALELVGQAGLGRSLDSLEGDHASAYGEAVKGLIPALSHFALWRRLLPVLIKLGPAAFRRWIVDHIPSKHAQKLRDVIHVLNTQARQLVAEKMDVLRGDQPVDSFDDIGDGKDIMSRLVSANMGASAGEALTEEEIVGQISTLVFAATDTTSSALSRILYLLARNPDVQTKLRAEIVEARRDGKDLNFDDLFELPYLEAVCRETLRLYAPVSSISKVAREDTVLPLRAPIVTRDHRELHSVPVPKGTTVVVGIAALNRDKTLWGPDALEWKPERWLAPLPDSIVGARVPGVYSNMLTFLGGGRACIGFKFSQCEMKVVLSILLESFAFELPDVPITWNSASVHYPSVGESTKAEMPMKVKRL